jgi:hypothetical protein
MRDSDRPWGLGANTHGHGERKDVIENSAGIAQSWAYWLLSPLPAHQEMLYARPRGALPQLQSWRCAYASSRIKVEPQMYKTGRLTKALKADLKPCGETQEYVVVEFSTKAPFLDVG